MNNLAKNLLNKFSILLCFYIIITFSSYLSAQTLGSLKGKYEYVGISPSEFNSFAVFGKQRNSNWCWAACVQMVLNYHRIEITQEQIVKKSLGKLINKPANPNTIFNALNGWKVDVYGKLVRINSNIFPTSTKEITTFLKTKKPLIVGLRQQSSIGHAYVLIGIYYEVIKDNLSSNELRPHSVILIDPSPGNSAIKDMSWSEFAERISVSFKVWVN